MSEESLRFTESFPPSSYDDWLKAVEPVLKGAPFEKKLMHRMREGFTLKPLYTKEDWPATGDPSGFPGFDPFTRGPRTEGRSGGVDIRQSHVHPDLAAVNADSLTDLQRGATSLTIRLDGAARAGYDGDQAPEDLAGYDGVMVYSADDLARLLDGVRFDLTPVALEAGAQVLPAAAMLVAVWRRASGGDAKSARGAFNADPIGTWAREGELPTDLNTALARMADLAAYTIKSCPHATAVAVDTRPYHGAGADEALDLACALSTGLAYLKAMAAADLDLPTACGQMQFILPVGCDLFLGIAKLRAARRLWSRVTEACGVPEAARGMAQHAVTADIIMSRRDPWVNMLRTTVAGFAAVVGGADIVTVQPFDAALGLPDAFSRRIARNTLLMLQEESSLNRVIDPVGGSWYGESLTDDLAKAAWVRFQEIEAAGGMVAALKSGLIADRIHQTHGERLQRLATRKEPVTGVSEFPNIQEPAVATPAPDYAALRATAAERLSQLRGQAPNLDLSAVKQAPGGGALTAALISMVERGATIGVLARGLIGGDGTPIAPLPRRRLAEPFEKLRDTADAALVKTGSRPAIFLANLGPIVQHTARASFAKNFFEAGGFAAIGSEPLTDPISAASAFKKTGARVAILCSSDALYEQMAAEIAPALKAAGVEYLYLAGHPGDKKGAYEQAGVDEFIFLGCDVLGTLRQLQQRLGVIEA